MVSKVLLLVAIFFYSDSLTFACPRIRSFKEGWLGLRLRLDVGIGRFGIELGSMPNQSNIGNGLQYEIHCLDVDEIVRWNPVR
jgi:hypothetical protein